MGAAISYSIQPQKLIIPGFVKNAQPCGQVDCGTEAKALDISSILLSGESSPLRERVIYEVLQQ